MQFFRLFVFLLILSSGAQASDLKDIIQSRKHGSCETNNLYFTAMKFYKIPLNEKHETYDMYLRIILFFNLDGSITERVTTQALLGCQTTSNGEVACSYHSLEDIWVKLDYSINGEIIKIKNIGSITLKNPQDTNRGFNLHFNEDFGYPHLRGQNFIGGMVSVNFDQDGRNTINICK